MAQYCTMHPKVRVNGELQDSELFEDIKNYTMGNRSSANKIYFSAKNNMADDYKGSKTLERNDQGELELKFILENFDLRSFLSEDFAEKLYDKFNLTTEYYSVENYTDLLKRCEELNNSLYGINYFATVKIINNKIKPIVKWKPKKGSFSTERENQSRSVKLSTAMTDLLRKWGIGIDTLYDAEERLSNGLVDTTSIEKAADGLYHIIRIAKGDKGLKALPEELGHTVVLALSDNPLMQRVLKLIKDHNLTEEILGDNYNRYSERYEYDEDKLAEEAAGKLMALHFLQQLQIEDDAVYKALLGRTVEQAKKMFSKFNETEVSNAVNEVNGNLSFITTNMINNTDKIKLSSRNLGKIFYQVSYTQEQVKRLRATLTKILKVEAKRYTIYKTKENAQLKQDLVNKIRKGDYKESVLTFLNESLTRIKNVVQELDSFNTLQNIDLSKKAAKLRYIRNTIFSYLKLLQDIHADLKVDSKSSDPVFDESVLELVEQEMSIIAKCLSEYNINAAKLCEDYLIPLLGDKMIMDKGWFKKDTKTYTVQDILNMEVDDISLFDVFTDSASDTSSYLIKGIDKAVKKRHNDARLQAMEFMQTIMTRTKQLERDGYKNQDWMFERDKEGKRTGYYMSKYNRGQYEKEKEEFKQKILESYPEDRRKDNEILAIVGKELIAWEQSHPLVNYRNDDWDKLTQIQKDYIKDVIELKAKLDKLLPRADVFRTIKIRKDLLERVKSSHSMKDALKSFSDSIKEGFVRDVTETEFGIKTVLTDFEGNTYRELPVFYQILGNNVTEEDISTDIVSTMTAYALMAYENFEMSKVIDILEILRSKVRDSENPYKTQGGKRLVEFLSGGSQAEVRSENNRILERLNELFDMQIYKVSIKDEGTIGKNLDKQKLTGRITEWSASVTMAFNVLNNISNVMTGNIQFKMEAVGGQFFTYKNAVRADKIYHQHLLEFLTDLGNRTKSSWLWTVGTTFNVMQDYPEMMKDVKFDKKFYERLNMNGISMLLQHAGEFWMQHRTFFALMDSDKEMFTDSKGNKIKAIDAFKVEPIDSRNPKDGSQVVFQKGLITNKGEKLITKEELRERAKKHSTTITDEKLLEEGEISEYDYINRMSRKSGKLNDHMHGVYNEEEKAVMYTRAWGRLVGQYRKWIKPSLNRRFKATQYDYDLETITEGTYRTAIRGFASILRHIKSKEFEIIVEQAKDIFRKEENRKYLEDYEASNLRQDVAELLTFALIILCISLLPDDDEDYGDSYFARLFKYELFRLKNEIGTLILGPFMIKEGLKLVQSPAASISLLERASNVFTLLTFWNWKEIQSGRYKGWYKPFNYIADIVPYNRAIFRTLHPEEAVKFYL